MKYLRPVSTKPACVQAFRRPTKVTSSGRNLWIDCISSNAFIASVESPCSARQFISEFHVVRVWVDALKIDFALESRPHLPYMSMSALETKVLGWI